MRGIVSELTGLRFGKLTVISREPNDYHGNSVWKCKCDCGAIKVSRGKDLISGNVKSCGCIAKNMQYEHDDLTGRRFGRLLVLSFDRMATGGHSYWKCKCDCGNTRSYSRSNLLNGNVKSCGCLRIELSKKRNRELFGKPVHTKYGDFYSRDWIVREYTKMIARCYNPNNSSYAYYHGNSITVSKRWFNESNLTPNGAKYKDDIGLLHFIDDMYEAYIEYAKRHEKDTISLDRIDGSLGYSKDNCRWATSHVQNNNLSSNRHIYDGEEILTFAECVRKYVPESLLRNYSEKPGNLITVKLNRGWTVHEIIRFLKHAKTDHILLRKKDMVHYLIRIIDQSSVYIKYPNEQHLPGY